MSDDERETSGVEIPVGRCCAAVSLGLGPGVGLHLPDPSNDNAIVRINWDFNSPEWRAATHGLNIEGITNLKVKVLVYTIYLAYLSLKGHCKNSSCRAYNETVTVKWGYRNDGVFDCFLNNDDCNCPLCNQHVEPENFGFSYTYYKVTGYKRDNIDGPLQNVDEDWKFASADHYTTFKNNEEDLVYWGQLVINVKHPSSSSLFGNL